MVDTHHLVPEAVKGDEHLFVCEHQTCGRTMVIDLSTRRLTVLDTGDHEALHEWSFPGVQVEASAQNG